MLKLTLAEYGSQSDDEVIYVNPSQIWHVKPHPVGCYVHCGSAMNGHGWYAKESAERVVMLWEKAKGKKSLAEILLEEAGDDMGIGCSIEGFYMERIE